jgi:hypothetical protein
VEAAHFNAINDQDQKIQIKLGLRWLEWLTNNWFALN